MELIKLMEPAEELIELGEEEEEAVLKEYEVLAEKEMGLMYPLEEELTEVP